MSQNPARGESVAVHVTHASTYATLALVAQSLVTLALPYAGLHLPPVVLAAIISVLVGGGTVVLHMAGLAVPGVPADGGKAQVVAALHTLLQEEGPALLARLTDATMAQQGPAPAPPYVAPAAPLAGALPLAGAEHAPAVDLSWSGPVGPRQALGAGHGPVPPAS